MKSTRFNIDNVRALQLFQVIRFGSLIIINIALVKLGISSSEIGFFESALFLSNLLTFYWINGCIQAFLPLYSKTIGIEKTSAFFNISVTISVLSIASGGLGFLLENILRKTESLSSFPFFKLAMAYTILSSMGQLTEFVYLLLNKPKKMILYGFVSHALQIACVIMPIFFNMGIKEAIEGLIAISFFRIAWLAVLIGKHSAFSIHFGFITKWLKQSFPLSIKYLLGNSANFADTIIITTFFSSSVFALYRYGAKDFPLTLLLANGLSTALLPLFGNNLGNALTQLRNRSRNLMRWLFPASILLMFSAKALYGIAFSTEFEASSYIFMIYLLLISSRLVFPQTVAIGMGKTSPLVAIAFIELIINVSLSFLWMQWWGIEGIAMATVVAFMTEKILIASYLYKAHDIKPNQYIPIKEYALWSIVLAASYLASRFLLIN